MGEVRRDILLVEDNVDIREGLADVLEEDGYSVTQACSAEEGLELLRGKRFNLVVSDFMLPIETGGWMLTEARRLNLIERTPAFLITAQPRCAAPEGIRVFPKPLDLSHFLREVSQAVSADAA